jgi:hypothetical protein
MSGCAEADGGPEAKTQSTKYKTQNDLSLQPTSLIPPAPRIPFIELWKFVVFCILYFVI